MVNLTLSADALTRDTFARELEQLVRQRTSGLIRGLRVECHGDEIIVSGRTSTYYAKQLATHAALDACENFSLKNAIEVL